MSHDLTRFCPNCGVANPIAARQCHACGHALPSREELAALWGRGGAARPQPPAPAAESRSNASPAGATDQETTALASGGRFAPKEGQSGTRPPAADPTAPIAVAEPAPDWGSPHQPISPVQPPRGRRGPGGCVLGGIAFLLICVVAGAFGWSAIAQPYLGNLARDQIREGASDQIERIERMPVLPSGAVVVTEAAINRQLQANSSVYEPIDDPTVSISPETIELAFRLYGVRSAYAGSLEVQDGRIVVVDGRVSGPAGRILSPNDLAAIVEEHLTTLLDRSNVRATNVRLDNGSLTIMTEAQP